MNEFWPGIGPARRFETRLTCQTAELPEATRRQVQRRVRRLLGYKASLLGSSEFSMSFEASRTGRDLAVQTATRALRDAGVAEPQVTAYTTWRVVFTLAYPMTDPQSMQPRLSDAGIRLGELLRARPDVFETGYDHAGFGSLTVDFRSEVQPSFRQLNEIAELIAATQARSQVR